MSVSFRVAQFVTLHKPFLVDFFVPSADGHDLEDLTFAGSTKSVKAVIRFATSDFPVGGQ
jgi:hypothetical protein